MGGCLHASNLSVVFSSVVVLLPGPKIIKTIKRDDLIHCHVVLLVSMQGAGTIRNLAFEMK